MQTPWAVFDFDHTLITHDSLPRFMRMAAGMPAFTLAACAGLAAAIGVQEKKTRIKEVLCRLLLKGKTPQQLMPAIAQLKQSLTWNTWVVERLRWHHAQGHKILIATGALELYMPALLAETPHDGMICVTLEQQQGRFTGRLSSPNTVREHKADAVRAFMAQHNGVPVWGYGNWRDDDAMLALCEYPVIIGK